jgi:hypothetical protein
VDNPVLRDLVALANKAITYLLRLVGGAAAYYITQQSYPGNWVVVALAYVCCVVFFFATFVPPIYPIICPDYFVKMAEECRSLARLVDASAAAMTLVGGFYLVAKVDWFLSSLWHAVVALLATVLITLLFLVKAFAIGAHRPSRLNWLSN